MSDIKAGDLVMVVRSEKCGCLPTSILGNIYQVDGFGERDIYCRGCGFVGYNEKAVIIGNGYLSICTLKKIPPLSELESVSEQRKDLILNDREVV